MEKPKFCTLLLTKEMFCEIKVKERSFHEIFVQKVRESISVQIYTFPKSLSYFFGTPWYIVSLYAYLHTYTMKQ